MAAARPVVATRLPEIREVVREGETGLLGGPGNKPQFTNSVRLLLGSEELRRRMGVAGRERARREFTVAQLVQAASQLYQGQSQVSDAEITPVGKRSA
jgi:glycosyltransferase involved in cell wall biosynthesis